MLKLLVGNGLEEAVAEIIDPFGVEFGHEIGDKPGQAVGCVLGDVGHGDHKILRQGLFAAFFGIRKLVEDDEKDMGPHLGLGEGHGSSSLAA